ncbi:DUF2860 domain-containing protein [Photobacterium chitinilyticum]|uniref:DUF2860 family protein n=1 Tax=Photobacterium chitinilyticum TaxID=2485123 RepID=UPI003D0B2440
MKSYRLYTLVAFTSLSATAYADETSRLTGEIIITSGYMSTNSNLSTDGDARLENTNDKSSHSNEFIVAPLGSISYQLGEENNQRVYLGTSREDLAVGDLAFEVGYQYDFSNGTQLDFAFLPTVVSGEVWADPYQTGSNRQKTDIDGYAFRMKLNNIMNSKMSLDMVYATAEVDNERIEHKSLHRDHDTYYIKGSHQSMLNERSGLISSVSYAYQDAIGKAATFDQYEAEMTYFTHVNAHSLALTGSYAYRSYDGANPVFDNKERTDNRYKLFLAYEYAGFAGWDNWSLVSLAGASFNTSNIDFYENEEYLLTIGMSYKF